MQEHDIEPEMLNAYVDGELPGAEAAAIARAAARNPSIAARIATLREMKAAIPGIVPDRQIELPVRPLYNRRFGAMAAAACTLLVLATALIFFLSRENEATRWANSLQDHHMTWSFVPGTAAIRALPVSGAASVLPLDLESARLTFVGHQKLLIAGRTVWRTGYEGTRGCRVSLYVFPADIVVDETAFAPSLLVSKWAIAGQTFALMADGMARGRFAGLARAVEKALRAGAQPDPASRQRLAHARRTSPPCQA